MSSQRYRRLLVNLPSMATVVNSFSSPDVQKDVYRLLVDALDEAVTEGDSPRDNGSSSKRGSRNGRSNETLAELVEGDSIHAIGAEHE
ncbi:MAG: hypothetical protein KDA75_10745 [Planctomycetaceae bacterium]|nr:hypothetical protein [Planctomycetaceae bacterium]